MGNSIARDDTQAGSNNCAAEASAHSVGSARAAQRHVREPANFDVPPSPTPTQTVQKAEEAPHVQFFDQVEEIPEI